MAQSEFDSLVPSREFARRSFVKAAVGSGFAAAVRPVSAQSIKTAADGLIAGPVTIPIGGVQMPAYRSMPSAPSASGKFPVVIVISEPMRTALAGGSAAAKRSQIVTLPGVVCG